MVREIKALIITWNIIDLKRKNILLCIYNAVDFKRALKV